jgi:tetratricopeptide (TPR) repeat protein
MYEVAEKSHIAAQHPSITGRNGKIMTAYRATGRNLMALIRVGLLLAIGIGVASCGPSDRELSAEHLDKGKALIAEGRYEAAAKELEQAAELDIDAIEPRILLGNTYRTLKQYDKAFTAYRAAKKVDRYDSLPQIENALTRIEVGDIDSAIEELNHAIELDPTNIRALLNLGRVSRMPRPPPKDGEGLGRFVNPDPEAGFQRAELNLMAAIEIVPDHILVNYELAKTYDEWGKPDQAVPFWKKVQKLGGGKPEHAVITDEATKALDRISR